MFTTAASTGEAMFGLRRPGYRANGRRGGRIALESANLEIDQLAIGTSDTGGLMYLVSGASGGDIVSVTFSPDLLVLETS